MGFQFLTSPRIIFGAGTLDQLPRVTAELGQRPLLVLGGSSARESGLGGRIKELIPVEAVGCCEGEPTVEAVDAVVDLARGADCDLVVAVGGGSALDCGKAAAAMLTNPGSLMDYLEGVGTGRQIKNVPCPMAAVPTTAGTGSEVTKNAVISGPGYKKSVRSPEMIPRVALVDPRLTLGMPRPVTASCGMDALIQLLEAYLSNGANPLTDGLALQGLELAGWGLLRAFQEPANLRAREAMSMASLMGGICLANAGLGAIHGFASPLGALFPIPHGVACAALLPQVMEANLKNAACHAEGQALPLERRFLRAMTALTGNPEITVEISLQRLYELQFKLEIPRLGELGISDDDFPRIVSGARGSSMRYNPVELTDWELLGILEAAL